MLESNVEIRTLSLVHLHIGWVGMKLIAKLVDESAYLEDLDISWNDLIPMHFTPLLEVLSRNKMLKSLNLSWNMIIDKAHQNNKVNFNKLSAMDTFVQRRLEALAAGHTNVETDAQQAIDHPKTVVYSFNQLIRYNTKI